MTLIKLSVGSSRHDVGDILASGRPTRSRLISTSFDRDTMSIETVLDLRHRGSPNSEGRRGIDQIVTSNHRDVIAQGRPGGGRLAHAGVHR